MRRTTWLAVGAILGVAGYRRLDRAARSLTDQIAAAPAGRHAANAPGPSALPAVRSTTGLAASSAGWLTRRVRRAWPDRRGPRTGVAAFIGDVRAGIDEYLDRYEANIDRQHSRSGNTLVGQRARGSLPVPGGVGGALGHRSATNHQTKDGR
jgi:hypothetical protein